MHVFNMVTTFLVLSLVSIEFSVSAFIHPAASQLDPEPQLKVLSRLALVLGRVMPVWYPACILLLALETWFRWHTPDRAILLAADAIWVLASLASIIFLVPLNTRVAQGDPDWQCLHELWDRRHRVRVAALAIAAVLFLYVFAR